MGMRLTFGRGSRQRSARDEQPDGGRAVRALSPVEALGEVILGCEGHEVVVFVCAENKKGESEKKKAETEQGSVAPN